MDQAESAWEEANTAGRVLANRCCYDEAKKYNKAQKEKQLAAKLSQLQAMQEKRS